MDLDGVEDALISARSSKRDAQTDESLPLVPGSPEPPTLVPGEPTKLSSESNRSGKGRPESPEKYSVDDMSGVYNNTRPVKEEGAQHATPKLRLALAGHTARPHSPRVFAAPPQRGGMRGAPHRHHLSGGARISHAALPRCVPPPCSATAASSRRWFFLPSIGRFFLPCRRSVLKTHSRTLIGFTQANRRSGSS